MRSIDEDHFSLLLLWIALNFLRLETRDWPVNRASYSTSMVAFSRAYRTESSL